MLSPKGVTGRSLSENCLQSKSSISMRKRRFMLTCIQIVATLSFIGCHALDPWPTINTSPQYSSSSTTRASPSQSIRSCQCKFFLWDIISYIKYRETYRKMQQNTYEGLGGRKFVRVQPGSYFERCLPQLKSGKLKKDGCWICGYSFREHLIYWSECKQRRRHSALDDYLDSIPSKINGGSSRDMQSFHKNYVEEFQPGAKRSRRKSKLIRASGVEDVSYLVPPFDPLADGKPKQPWTVFMLLLARNAALERVDDLIWFSRVESEKEHHL